MVAPEGMILPHGWHGAQASMTCLTGRMVILRLQIYTFLFRACTLRFLFLGLLLEPLLKRCSHGAEIKCAIVHFTLVNFERGGESHLPKGRSEISQAWRVWI